MYIIVTLLQVPNAVIIAWGMVSGRGYAATPFRAPENMGGGTGKGGGGGARELKSPHLCKMRG